MKAARLHAYGGRLRLDDVPEPSVDDPFDVIVRIAGAGLCRTDLHVVEGRFAGDLDVRLPYTLGHENAGWVVAAGAAVTTVEAGDPVVVHPLVTCGLCRACRAGADMHCERSVFPGLTADGGFAELLRTSARALVKLGPGVEPADVAVLADAGLAAYHAVKKAAPGLYPGTRAVVLGAGGLGHLAVQCLRALTPAEVVAVDSLPGAVELARRVGAHHGVVADGDQLAAVRDLTDGGAEVVLDFVGEGGAVADGLAMLRRGGTYFAVGYGGTLSVPTVDLVAAEVSVVGNLVGSYNELAELLTLAAQGRIEIETTRYPLDAVGDAVADLEGGRVRGRAVLVPSAVTDASPGRG